MPDPQVPVELDPRFQKLSPEEQSQVRAAWTSKLAALQPAERDAVWTAWKKKFPAAAPAPETLSQVAAKRKAAPVSYLGEPAGHVAETSGPTFAPTVAERGQEFNEAAARLWKIGPGIMEALRDPNGAGAQLLQDVLTVTGPPITVPSAVSSDVTKGLAAAAGVSPEVAEKMGQRAEQTTGVLVGGGLAAHGAGKAPEPKATPRTLEETLEAWKAEQAAEQAPPPASARPSPAPPGGGLETLEMPPNAPSKAAMALETQPSPEEIVATEKALQGIQMPEGGEPESVPYEPAVGGRGPRAPLEPSETVPRAEYPGPTGELTQEGFLPQGEEPAETIEPEPPWSEQHPGAVEGQAGPAQDEFHNLPPNLGVGEEPGVTVELARQEAILDGQMKAAETLRAEIPDSESADAIEAQAAETKRKIDYLRAEVEKTKAASEPPVVKNPPASPELEAALHDELRMKGVDPTDPQAVMDEMSKGAKKPVQVTTVGTYPVSKTTETANRYEADLAENKPSTVLHERQHVGEAEGTRGPVPEGPGANDRIVTEYLTTNRMASNIAKINVNLQRAAAALENTPQQIAIALGHAKEIGETGTFGDRPLREEFREAGPKPEVSDVGVSRNQVRDINARLADAGNVVLDAMKTVREMGASADRAGRITANAAMKNFKAILRELTVARRAASKSLYAFQEAGALSPEMIARLREVGLTLDELKTMKVREPLFNAIAQAAKAWKNGELTAGEATGEILRNGFDALRYGLFTPFSWGLHVAMSDIPGQIAGSAMSDFLRAARTIQGQGDLTAPALRAWVYSFGDRLSKIGGRGIDPRIEQAIGEKTLSGEQVRGGFTGKRGTYLWRKGPVSTAIDETLGSPLYAKVALDRAAGNLSAYATIWQRALERTPKELSGDAARQWQRNFVDHAPDDVIAEAVENAKKAKFQRDLTSFESRNAGSTWYRMLVDVWSRWEWQSARAIGEWMGYNPDFFKALAKDGFQIDGDKVGKYMGKTLTGLGAFYIANQLYDNVDFHSMQYVHKDEKGNEVKRTRLVEPIPALLVLGSMMRAVADAGLGRGEDALIHLEKGQAALQYASLPFARVIASLPPLQGELGGIFSVLTSWAAHGGKNTQIDPNGMWRDFRDQVIRTYPGSSVLAGLKYIFDPVEREGWMARLPGLSLAEEQKPNTTQGGAMIRKRELPGGAGEVAVSANIPWSSEKEDPVKAMLMQYGEPVYRGPRTPIAGVPASALPDQLLSEYREELGLARQRILGPLAYRLSLENNDFQKLGPEKTRAIIRKLDGVAAKQAANAVTARHAPRPKPFRRETMQEILGPSSLHAGYTLTKEAREAQQRAALGPEE